MALTPSSLETTYHTSDKMKGRSAGAGTSTSILFRPAVLLGSDYDHDHHHQQQQQEAATNNNIQTTRPSLINFRNNWSGRPTNIDRSLLSFAQDSDWTKTEHLISSCSFESSGRTATAFVDPNYTSCSTNETHVDPALAAGEWFCSDDVVFPDPGIQLPNSLKRTNHNYTGDSSRQIAKKQCSSTSTSTKKLATQKSSGASKDPQSIAAKNRRERISERLKMLQDLVPNGSKVDLVTMLEKAISYVKFLQLQVKVLATDEFWPAQGGKAPDISQVKEAIEAILLSSQSQRDRTNSCTTTPSTSKE